jgi:hypothetical protein
MHKIARGGRPGWSQKGKDLELFFVPGPAQFVEVTVRTQPTFSWSTPVDVPRRFGISFPANPRPYDVLPDGRFVTIGAAHDAGDQGTPQIHVVLNWFEELRKTQAVNAK